MKKSLKLGLKIAGLSVALIPASVGALAFIDVPTTLTSKAPVNNKFFRNCIDETAAKTPITQLAMLGSHDSLSNGITIGSAMDPYSPNTTDLAKIAKYVGPGAMVRLSKAQYDDIYTQLNAGVRYVDARITHVNGQYYTHHTVISDTLEHYLKEILRWLNDNRGEFIIFHIYYFNYCKDSSNPAYETSATAWANLKTYIESVTYNGMSLLDYDYTYQDTISGKRSDCYVGNITYNDVTKNGSSAGAVVYFSSDDTSEAKDDEWCYKHIYHGGTKYIINPCANSMNTDTVIQNVKKAESQGQNKTEYIRYAQTQTTPNVNEVAKTITGWSLLQKAHEHNAYMLRKSGLKWSEIFNSVPIYLCDFATDNTNGFCQELIDKMTAFNQSL